MSTVQLCAVDVGHKVRSWTVTGHTYNPADGEVLGMGPMDKALLVGGLCLNTWLGRPCRGAKPTCPGRHPLPQIEACMHLKPAPSLAWPPPAAAAAVAAARGAASLAASTATLQHAPSALTCHEPCYAVRLATLQHAPSALTACRPSLKWRRRAMRPGLSARAGSSAAWGRQQRLRSRCVRVGGEKISSHRGWQASPAVPWPQLRRVVPHEQPRSSSLAAPQLNFITVQPPSLLGACLSQPPGCSAALP